MAAAQETPVYEAGLARLFEKRAIEARGWGRNIEMGLAGHLPGGASDDGLVRLYQQWHHEAEQKATAAIGE